MQGSQLIPLLRSIDIDLDRQTEKLTVGSTTAERQITDGPAEGPLVK